MIKTSFFSDLQKHLLGKWEYTSNSSGEFLRFVWHWDYDQFHDLEYEYYLQIQSEKSYFKFKVKLNSDDKGLCRIIRDNYRKKLFGKAKGYGIQIEERPRIGKDMTVAILSSDFRELDKKGLIDIKKTAEKILKIQKMVSSI